MHNSEEQKTGGICVVCLLLLCQNTRYERNELNELLFLRTSRLRIPVADQTISFQILETSI